MKNDLSNTIEMLESLASRVVNSLSLKDMGIERSKHLSFMLIATQLNAVSKFSSAACINELKKFIPMACSRQYRNALFVLLPQIIQHLDALEPINEEVLGVLKSHLCTVPFELLSKIRLKPDSVSAKRLQQAGLAMQCVSEQEWHTNIFNKLSEKLPSTSTLDQYKADEAIREKYITYVKNRLCLSEITDQIDNLTAIRALQFFADDRLQFAIDFFKKYVESITYCHFWRRPIVTSFLLKYPMVITALTEPLEIREIDAFINIQSGIEDPQTAETDNAYEFYEYMNRLFVCEPIQRVRNSSYPADCRLLEIDNILLQVMLYQHKGRRAFHEFDSLELKSVLPFPWLLQALYADIQEPDRLTCFLKKWHKANQKAKLFQKRHFSAFFVVHHRILLQLEYIFGNPIYAHLEKELGQSVLVLERNLSILTLLPHAQQVLLKDYVARLAMPLSTSDRQSIIDVCIMLAVLNLRQNHTIADEQDSIDDEHVDYTSITTCFLEDHLKHEASPHNLLLQISREVITSICVTYDGILSSTSIEQMLSRYSASKLAELAAATREMHLRGSEYTSAYLDLVRHDLFQLDVDAYLHDTTQLSQPANNIAKHNQKILAQLKSFGIDESATKYQKVAHQIFRCSGNDSMYSEPEILTLIHADLVALQQVLLRIPEGPFINASQKIQTQITELLVTKKNIRQRVRAWQKDSDKIHRLHRQIIALLQRSDVPEVVTEFGEHFLDRYKLLVTFKSEQHTKTAAIEKEYFFTFKQWDKSHPNTFFLGEEVGCCLSVQGGQFASMVQRRLDDAMLFHTAIDQETGKVAALLWLYIAIDHNGNPFLMMNFSEVNSKYAQHEALRKSLLDGLLQFTQSYADEMQLPFYMNQLSYGWNQFDLKHYPISEIIFDTKVGGPLIPALSPEELDAELRHVNYNTANRKLGQLTCEHYYLDSLRRCLYYGKLAVHKFDAVVHAKYRQTGSIAMSQLLQQTVFTISQGERDVFKVTAEAVAMHKSKLQKFYELPLEANALLQRDINDAFTKAIAFRKKYSSGPKLPSISSFFAAKYNPPVVGELILTATIK